MATRTLVKGDPARLKFIASPWHLLIVITIAGPNAYRGAIYAVHASSGRGPSRSQMYLRTIAFECGFLAIVGLGVWLHGSSLHTIFAQPWRRYLRGGNFPRIPVAAIRGCAAVRLAKTVLGQDNVSPHYSSVGVFL